MPPDRSLLDAVPGADPQHTDVQQLIEAESGHGTQGILRRWQASDSVRVVLTSDSTGVKISRDNGVTAPAQVIVDGTTAGGALTGTYPSPTVSPAGMDAIIPPGTIWAYAGAGFPAGWLPCNGAAVPRASFAKLFAVIGTTYNVGGEAGTDFRLPNLVGRVILGVSGAHPLSELGGAETGGAHTHTGSHSHGGGGLAFTLSGHTHPQGTHTHDAGSHSHDIGGHAHGLTDHVHQPGSHTHGLNSHRHDIGHEHLSPPTHPAVTSASATALNGRFTAGGANALPDAHTHPYDVPALGVTNSGVPSAAVVDTATPSANNSGGLSVAANTGTALAAGFANTGLPSAATGGVTAGAGSVGTPSSDTTGTSSGTTATDSSAPAAVYSAATANLMPFLSVAYIIRTG